MLLMLLLLLLVILLLLLLGRVLVDRVAGWLVTMRPFAAILRELLGSIVGCTGVEGGDKVSNWALATTMSSKKPASERVFFINESLEMLA